MKKYIIILLTIVSLLLISPSSLLAQTPCTVVFGGGTQANGQPFCMESMGTTPKATPPSDQTDENTSGFGSLSQTPNQTPSAPSGQSKGGLTIQPATGPEQIALLALLPLALAGLYLRKKSSLSAA